MPPLARMCLTVLIAATTATAAQGQVRPEVSPRRSTTASIEAGQRRGTVIFRVRSALPVSMSCHVEGLLRDCVPDAAQLVGTGDTAVRVPVRFQATGVGTGAVLLVARTEAGVDTGRYEVRIVPPGQLPRAPADTSTAGDSARVPGPRVRRLDPIVFISPPSATSPDPIDIEIEWCSGDQPLVAGSRKITFPRRTDVTAQFNYVSGLTECSVETKYSYGTITPLSELGSVLTASICDSWGQCGSESGTYYLVPPPVPAAPIVDLGHNPGLRVARSACVSREAGPAALMQCGDLVMLHSLPAFRSLNRDRTLTLMYLASAALPRPSITVSVAIPGGAPTPDSVTAQLSIGTSTYAFLYSGAGFTPGGSARRLLVRFDAEEAGLATGVHPYTVTVRSRAGATTADTTVAGELIVIDRSAGALGSGWSVAGVERLFKGQRGGQSLLLISGDGSAAVYDPAGTNTWRAVPGAYRDTIRKSAVSGDSVPADTWYWRRGLDGTRAFYDTATGRLRWVVDRVGNKVEYRYVNLPEDTAILDIRIAPYAADRRYRFAYIDGRVDSIIDPAGRLLRAVVDGQGQLTSLRDPGLADTSDVRFEYTDGLLTRRRSARGFWSDYTYHDGLTLLRSAQWPTGAVTTFLPWEARAFSWPPASLSMTVSADSAVSRIDGPRPNEPDTVQFTTGAAGQPLRVTDAVGLTYTLAYGDTALPLLPTVITAPDQQQYRFYYDTSGRDTLIENVVTGAATTQVRSTYASNSARESPTRIRRDRAGGIDTTTFTYNTNGTTNTITDARGHVTRFGYQAGQVITITEQAVSTWTTFAKQDTVLDQVWRFAYGNTLRNTDTTVTPGGRITAMRYDNAGRVTGVRGPLNDTSSMVYTSMNRMERETRYDENDVAHAVTRTFDADGNVTEQVDPRGVGRRWRYDALGRDTLETDEFNRSARKAYDLAGNLVRVIDRQGDTIRLRWDAAGRVAARLLHAVKINDAAEVQLYGGSVGTIVAPGDSTGYSYDSAGRLWRVANGSAVITRAFDGRSRLTQETQLILLPAAPQYVHGYTYFPTGERQTYTSPYGRTHTYTYGRGSALDSLRTSGPRGELIRVWWDMLGRPDSLLFRGNVSSRYRYDIDGNLREARTRTPNPDSVLLHLSYVMYDDARRLRELWDSSAVGVGATARRWSYDLLGNMTADSSNVPNIWNRYTYDRSGNRRSQTRPFRAITLQYQLAGFDSTNRVASLEETSGAGTEAEFYSYDRNGTLIKTLLTSTSQPEEFTYRTLYNAAGQLVRVTDVFQGDPADTAFFYYDGLGRQVARRQSPSTTAWLTLAYDGANVSGVRGNGEILHAPGLDSPVRAFLPLVPDGNCAYGDSLDTYYVQFAGRALAYFNRRGTNCFAGDAWADWGAYAGAIANSYGFDLSRSAAHTDAGGISYFRNRWYDSRTGRFMQEDPIGYEGGLNLYAYGNNNPAVYTDPFGLSPDTVWVGVRRLQGLLGFWGNHAAVRVNGHVGELLNSDGTNVIDVRSAEAGDLARYNWINVPVPSGMTSEQFDAAVAASFNQNARAAAGKPYSPAGSRNSNRFIWEVITEAGGIMPRGVERLGPGVYTPGICGGGIDPLATGLLCGVRVGGNR